MMIFLFDPNVRWYSSCFNGKTLMKNLSQYHITLANILVGACFISFSGIWVAWSGVNPTVSAFYRVFFGALFLMVPCIIHSQFRKLDLPKVMMVSLCGLCFAADLLCWHSSINYIGPGLATIIGNFQVFILTLISFLFFGEKITIRFLVSVPLAILGLLLIIGFSWSKLPSGYATGIWLGIATAVFYSGFILSLGKIQKMFNEPLFFFNLLLVSIASATFLGGVILFTGSDFTIPTLSSLGSLLGLALLSQTIGWNFISKGLAKIAPFIAGIILLLQPALAFIWDVLIFNRQTFLINWLGVIIALSAIYMGMTSTGKKAK